MDLVLYMQDVRFEGYKIVPFTFTLLNGLRCIIILISLVFIYLSQLPCSPDGIKPIHKRYIIGYLFVILLCFGVLNSIHQFTKLNIPSVYILAVIISSAFLYLSRRESALIFSLTGGLSIVLLLMHHTNLYITTARCITILVVTVLGFILSLVTYSARVKEFMSQLQIEHQKEALAHSNDLLLRLSYLDALTGIPNRRFMEDIINREWRQAVREQTWLSVMIIDIDNFKQYNDLFGHQAGDDCLRIVATTLTKLVKRPRDAVTRYGGEEFLAILPTTNIKVALQIAGNMISTVNNLEIPHPDSPYKFITISIGLACRQPSRNDSLDGLIAAADKALYQAKGRGRNQIACADLGC